MESSLARDAISAALSCQWEEAIALNSQILKNNPTDVDALNRIARAYAENGAIGKAKKITQQVLELDPVNTIAIKCLLRWNNYTKKDNGANRTTKYTFIEEPTKTKVVELINLGDSTVVFGLNCGDIVQLVPHPHRVSVVTAHGKYIGRFPDNLALKFISLIKTGGTYEVCIKTAKKNEVRVFVRSLTKNDL